MDESERNLGRRSLRRHQVEALCPMLDERELSQQSIVKTTHFFSFTELFGRNTQFSVCLRNTLLFKWLRWFLVILHSEFDLTHCRWACFALRNMSDRKTIPSQRWLGLASFATRYMPNGTRTSHFWCYDGAKMTFSLSISRKIPTQLFNQKTGRMEPVATLLAYFTTLRPLRIYTPWAGGVVSFWPCRL